LALPQALLGIEVHHLDPLSERVNSKKESRLIRSESGRRQAKYLAGRLCDVWGGSRTFLTRRAIARCHLDAGQPLAPYEKLTREALKSPASTL